MQKQRKTIYDFMLQGSLYETLTSKINRLGNFSYLTCVDIIFSRGPSNAPFLFKAWNTSSIFCLPSCAVYFSPVIWFVFVQISCFLIFLCGTHGVVFFLPQPVQLLFWILPHREYLFIFYSNIALLTHRVQLLFCILPHRANLPATSSDGGFSYSAILAFPNERTVFSPFVYSFIFNGAPKGALI